MKEPRQGEARPRGAKENRDGFHSTSACACQSEIILIRREECRHCPGEVWAAYYFSVDGNEAGWGTIPIPRCQNARRCGDKVYGAEFDDVIHLAARREGVA